ncbi:hypothetical protein KSS87_002322 [Heliosperma pusillum]|nr:hypothetical protein KSS87_002322 [Heliosperma pusillum]
MNIFRLAGDLTHLISILVLLLKIYATKSCSGISLKTQELFALVFLTRYLDLFTDYISLYNSVMKIVFIVSSLAIVWCMRMHPVIRRSYDRAQDTFRHFFLVLGCFVLALLVHEKFTFQEVFWAFSIYLEAVAILPQLVLLQRSGNVDNLTAQYVLFLGSASVAVNEVKLDKAIFCFHVRVLVDMNPTELEFFSLHLWSCSDWSLCRFLLLLLYQLEEQHKASVASLSHSSKGSHGWLALKSCFCDGYAYSVVRKPTGWAFTEPITRAQLNEKRQHFWSHLPRRGTRGNHFKLIGFAAYPNNLRFCLQDEHWNAIREACEVLLASEEDAPPLATQIIDNSAMACFFCIGCSRRDQRIHDSSAGNRRGIVKPIPRAYGHVPITRAALTTVRDTFWSQPPDGSTPEIWNALRNACDAMMAEPGSISLEAKRIIEEVGLQRDYANLEVCYDNRRGMEYYLPNHIQCDPTNLIDP